MISKYSVKKPYTILVGVVLVLVLGYVSFTKMTTDLLPNMSLPYALVITTDVGASPEEVEADVSAPIEAAMATTSNIRNISSTSYNSYSVVILEYEQSANMDSVLIEIQQKLDQLSGTFKDSVGTPMIMQLDPEMMPIMIAAADVDDMSEVELSNYVENELKPAIESVEGAASVSAIGLLEQNIQVTMNQEKIDELNKKIQEKIKEQFKDAETELAKSEKEIKDGQSALTDGKEQLTTQVSSATKDIINQKIELSKKEDELASQLSQLQETKKQLEDSTDMMQKAYDGALKLQSGIDGLTELKAKLQLLRQGTIAALLQVNPEATEEMQQAAADEAVKQALEAASKETGMELSDEQALDMMLATMKEQLAGINVQIRKEADLFKDTGVKVTSYKDLPKVIAALSENLTQVNVGITQIKEGQKQVADGKVSLDDALEKINQTQINSVLEMSNTSSQLSSAASQIAEGQKQLETTKENALNSADLNNILSISNLNNILKAQNFAMPAGYANSEDGKYLVRVGDKVSEVEELKQLILLDVGMDGIEPIKLSEVADVELVNKVEDSYSKVNGNPAIMLTIEKQTGYSTGDVTKSLQARFASLEKGNDRLHLNILMNQGVYIDIIVKSVLENMIVGAILAILVLIIFLKDFKPTLIIACSIPLSVVFAIVLMYFTNVSLNIISLSGLALGIGMLVDNSIVVIENIYRLRHEGYSIRKAAVEGASQVGGAIIASTLTTVCVFAPIIFTEGITRQLFVDIALTIAFTLGASLVVALTFVPMMAAGILKRTKEVKHNFFEKIQNGYGRFLKGTLRFKPLVFLGVIALLVLSTVASLSRGFSFMDMDMSTNQLSVTIGPKENQELSFEELTKITDEVMERLADVEGIQTIGAMSGSGSMLASMGGGASSSMSMYLVLDENSKRSSNEIKKNVEERTKGFDCEISTDNSASDFTAMMGNGISVQIKGSNMEILQKLAGEIGDIVRNTEGTEKVKDGLGDTTPSFTIVVDKEKAAKYKMTVAQVFQLVYSKMASTTSATTVSTDLRDYEVYIQSEEQSDITIDDLRKLTFSYTNSEGKSEDIKLSEIAEFKEGISLNSINRDAQTRYLSVTASVDEAHNVTKISSEIQKEIKKLEIPEGYKVKMAGEDERIYDAMEQLVLMLILAIVFIYLVMVAQFQSLLSPFIIMFTIPLAFTGGLFALFFTGNEVSVIAMIGFVMLSGIIVNNGIVMVDYINQLRREGYEKKEAIVEAGKTRLRPILMTALTTILAMSTMALGSSQGSEMMQPMAIVTIGGLIYGTLLTLIVVPCIYDAFHRNKSMVEEEL